MVVGECAIVVSDFVFSSSGFVALGLFGLEDYGV